MQKNSMDHIGLYLLQPRYECIQYFLKYSKWNSHSVYEKFKTDNTSNNQTWSYIYYCIRYKADMYKTA